MDTSKEEALKALGDALGDVQPAKRRPPGARRG